MMKRQFIIDNRVDETYYYVAALNTMGVIYLQDNKLDKADEVYHEIFKIDSTFQLAKNNYDLLQQLKTKQENTNNK